jgi:hypothetical protein
MRPLEDRRRALESVSMSDSPRNAKAKQAAQLVADNLAAPAWRQDALTSIVDSLPTTSEGLARLIRSHVEQSAPSTRPRGAFGPIPLTGVGADGFDSRFSRDGLKTLLDAVKGLRDAAAKQAVGGAVLTQRINAFGERIVHGYLDAYAKYWSRQPMVEVGDNVRDWNDFVAALRAVEPYRLNEMLSNRLDETLAALNVLVNDAGQADAHQQAIKETQALRAKLTPRFDEECKRLKNAWTSLPTAAEARRKMLASKPGQLVDEFCLNIDVPYWQEVALAGLACLAADSSAGASAELRDFRQLQTRFPISKLKQSDTGESGDELTASQLDRARQLIAALGKAAASTPGATVGEGARTNIDRVDEQLAYLRGKAPNLARYSAVVNGLGTEREPLRCTIRAIDTDVAQRYPYVRFVDDDGRVSTVKIAGQAPGTPVTLATVNVPARPQKRVTLQFCRSEKPGGDDRLPLTMDGWHCLKLLHENRATRSTQDPSIWTYRQDVDDLKCTIQLQFLSAKGGAVELPLLKDWPGGAR